MRGNNKNLKIGAIIQARMDSTRLPGKVLMDIAGKPMLWHVIERVKKCKKIDYIVVAITNKAKDKAIIKLAKKCKVKSFAGSENNVLDRYYRAAKKFNVDIIVRITSDCPLIDPKIIDTCIKRFLNEKCDYISNCFGDKVTFPRGLDVSVFSFSVLEKAHNNATEAYEKEHVVPYFWANKNNEFKIGKTIQAPADYARNYRLTVDCEKDLVLIKKIYKKFYKTNEIIDTLKVISFLDRHPEIAQINIGYKQKPFK